MLSTDVISQVQKLLEDPDGQFYDIQENIIPSVNEAIQWVVSVITPKLYSGKYSAHALSEITSVAIFQTNKFGRVSVNPDDIGKIWAITCVYPKPRTIITQDAGLTDLFYYHKIKKYVGKIMENAPVVQIYGSEIPAPDPNNPPPMNPAPQFVVIKDHDSIFRPEMSFVGCKNSAEYKRMSEIRELGWSEHEAGSRMNAKLFNRYAYSMPIDYSSIGYHQNYAPEIEIFPNIGRAIVGIEFVKSPDLIPDTDYDTFEIKLPDALKSVLVRKSLSVIAGAEGDKEAYAINENEVLQIIGAQ